MGVLKTPKAPDPYQTARAQSAQNEGSAISTALLNSVDRYGPNGNVTTSQEGTWDYTDPVTGQVRTLPKLVERTTLDPLQQQALDLEKQVDVGTNKTGLALLNNVQGDLSKPVDDSEAAIRAKTDAMINPRLADRFGNEEAKLRDSLINRGVREGSQAFNDAFKSFSQGRNDAYMQEALANRQQALQEIEQSGNRSINRLGALMGTGQVALPQFGARATTNIAAPDLAGMIYQNYQARQNRSNAAMGGLFSLGGSLLGAGSRMASAYAGG